MRHCLSLQNLFYMTLLRPLDCSSNTNSYICLCIKYLSVLDSFLSSTVIQTNNLVIKIGLHKWTWFIPSYVGIWTRGLSFSVLTLALGILGFVYIVACSVSEWGTNTSIIKNETPKVKSEQALGRGFSPRYFLSA